MVTLYCQRCGSRTAHVLLGSQGRTDAVCSVCGRTKPVMLVRLRMEQEKTVSIIYPADHLPREEAIA